MIAQKNMGLPPFDFTLYLICICDDDICVNSNIGQSSTICQRKIGYYYSHVTIAVVGNTSPVAGIDHVSVARIATYNAATSSRNIEQKIITVSWGDGTTSQSKITRIPSSSESKWGPLYHKYDSATASNRYAIVAILDALSSSSSKGIVQIKSEPYLVNVQKGPTTGYSSDSLGSNISLVPKNNELLFSPTSHLGNIIALSVVVSATVFSLCIVRHMRKSSHKMIPTIDAYIDEKQNHHTTTRTFDKAEYSGR